MKCSPEFRKRVAEQAELARRKTGRGCTGQLFFTYGEVKWILEDLQALYAIEEAEKPLAPEDAARVTAAVESVKITPTATPLLDHVTQPGADNRMTLGNADYWQGQPPI